jgi:hypothetical protein
MAGPMKKHTRMPMYNAKQRPKKAQFRIGFLLTLFQAIILHG